MGAQSIVLRLDETGPQIVLDFVPPLEEAFTGGEREDVRRFLACDPDLQFLLGDAREALCESFGSGCERALSVVSDPDADGREQLVLSIRTELPASEAMARLDAFDNHWWLSAVPRARGRLVILLDWI